MTTDDARSPAATMAAQHARLRTLISELHDAPDEQRGERFADAMRYLAIQEAAEHVYLPPSDDGHDISLLVTRLEQLGPQDPYFLIQLGLLDEAVARHATPQETGELPASAMEGLDRVDELYADRGPGAAVPVGGGFAAQYEAARAALARPAAAPERPSHEPR